MINQLSRKLLAQIVASSQRALLRGDGAASTCGWLPSAYAQLSTTASLLQQSEPPDQSQSTQPSGKKVLASILLERLPIVAPPLPKWYLDYEEWKFKDEEPYFRQYTGEFEQLRSAGEPELDPDLMGDPDKHQEEIEAVENGDITSPWRRLDAKLLFLCKLRDREEWTFPDVEHKEGETLRQTAERAVSTMINTSKVQVFMVGNQPACHWETDDSLIFYFRCVIFVKYSYVGCGGGCCTSNNVACI